MNEKNVNVLGTFCPAWVEICDCYDSLVEKLKNTVKDPKEFLRREEALVWEQFAFELVISLFLKHKIDFEIGKLDVQPFVKDVNGTPVEIDFRIRAGGKVIYFDVTHFYGGIPDLVKDIEKVNIPIKSVVQGSQLITNAKSIVTIRPQREYLNRKMVNRVSSQGQHKFDNDLIYIFFPKTDLGFCGGVDAVADNFNFESKFGYEYRSLGISGVMLIGVRMEIGQRSSAIKEEEFIIKTKVFDGCSSEMRKFLNLINNTIVDMRERIEQVKSVISKE